MVALWPAGAIFQSVKGRKKQEDEGKQREAAMYSLPTVCGATMPVSTPRRSSSTVFSAIGTTAPDDPYEVLSLVEIT